VLPSGCITWFQANQACLLSGKRLLTNREWQGAAASTPDPGTDNGTTDCNISTAGVQLARRFGEAAVRTFLLFFWASYHFLTTNRTQAYHLVAGRTPRGEE